MTWTWMLTGLLSHQTETCKEIQKKEKKKKKKREKENISIYYKWDSADTIIRGNISLASTIYLTKLELKRSKIWVWDLVMCGEAMSQLTKMVGIQKGNVFETNERDTIKLKKIMRCEFR